MIRESSCPGTWTPSASRLKARTGRLATTRNVDSPPEAERKTSRALSARTRARSAVHRGSRTSTQRSPPGAAAASTSRERSSPIRSASETRQSGGSEWSGFGSGAPGITRAALRPLPQPVVDEDERGHGLHHGHGARKHARVVAAPGAQRGGLARGGHRFLLLEDRGRGLEGDADDDVLSVRDPSLHASRAVRAGAHLTGLHVEGIVVLAPGEERPREAGADLETLRGRKGEHGLGEVGLEAVEDGLPEAGGNPPRGHLDHAANGIAVAADSLDAGGHAVRAVPHRTAHDVPLDRIRLHGRWVHGGLDVLDPPHPGHDPGAGSIPEDPLRDGAGSDPADGLAGARAAAALPGPDAELRIIGVVRVGRAVDVLQGLVGLGPRILVPHEEPYRRARREAVLDPREDLHPVALLSLSRDGALAGPAAVEIALDLRQVHGDPGRTSVDDDADRGSVRLSPGRDREQLAEGAPHA